MATDVNENINSGKDGDSELQNGKDTDWKRRTLELEEQLCFLRDRVNSQTGKIREAVSKRLKTAEETKQKQNKQKRRLKTC